MKKYFLFITLLLLAMPSGGLAAPTSLVQTVKVENIGLKGSKISTFVVPGIGQGELRCQQRATWIKFQPYNRNRESNFWSTKYEMKQGEWSTAVKNARVYRYAHAEDDGKGGTGATTRQGLNQFFSQKYGVENDAQGYLYGVFSQRLGRNQSIGDYSPPPATYVYLTWYWKGMRKGDKQSECFINAKLITPIDKTNVAQARTQVKEGRMRFFKSGHKYRSFGNKAVIRKQSSWSMDLNWHGEADSAPKGKDIFIKDIGKVSLRCNKDEGSITVSPNNTSAGAYAVSSQGEGYEADDKSQYFYDPLIESISPLPLPTNGMLRVGLQIGNKKYQMNVSTIRKVNDPNPALNFCETSVFVTAV